MSGTAAKVLLCVFGNLLMYFVPAAAVLMPGFLSVAWLFVLIYFTAHIMGSVVSCRRFKRKFEMSPGKYVMYGAMPAAALSVISATAWFVLLSPAVEKLGDLAYVFLVFSIFSAAYSVLYLIILTAVVSRYE